MTTDLGGVEVDEYVMIIVYRVCKCRSELASALEVFSTDKTSVNVDVRKGDGADLFKIKVECSSVDGIKIEIRGSLRLLDSLDDWLVVSVVFDSVFR
jgi:hypothetical protein